MSSPEEIAITQAEGALGLLSEAERPDAEALVELCRALFSAPESVRPEQRTRLLRLIEVLARRSASAMPYAALGRALSARLAGDETSTEELLCEFEIKLQMLGL